MIVLNPFVLRQTLESQFSHWEFSNDELASRTKTAFKAGQVEEGYRPGVVLVQIDPEGVYTGVCQLEAGDTLAGRFEARRDGEDPRRSVWKVGGKKLPAKRVDVVLYASSVLAEDNSQSIPPEEGNWEVVSVNARLTEGPEPLKAGTLMANHFHQKGSSDGGTTTKMSDTEFVAALKESYEYWKDKASVAPLA